MSPRPPSSSTSEGHNPGDDIEAATDRGGKNNRAIFGHEDIEDGRFVVAGVELGMQFRDHDRRNPAADVVAFHQDLGAAALAD